MKDSSFSSLIGTLFTNKHSSVYDPEYQNHLKNAPWEQWLSQAVYFDVKKEYIDTFIQWIYSSKQNHFSKNSLNKFKRTDIIVGTTQSFDEAYFRYHDKRLRLFRGEYAYHRRCFKNHLWLDLPKKTHPNGDWAEPLEQGDWVIVSQPFCGTGDEHSKFAELLDKCKKKDIPVVIDCAWFGTCFDINFDFDHPAITEVSFSLTKGIGLGYMRTGLRFSNYPLSENKPIAQHNLYNHLVFSNCQIGIWQMNRFDPDWSIRKYLKWYKQLCNHYNMLETKCLHISLLPLYNEQADRFLIDDSYAKVAVREALKAVRKKELILKPL